MEIHRVVATIKAAVAATLTAIQYMIGGFDVAMQTLITFMVIDIITGVSVATVNKEVESLKMWLGLTKKLLTFLVIVAALSLDRLFGTVDVIRTFAIYFYVATEGLSIVENAGKIGFPIPKNIKDILAQLKDTENKPIQTGLEKIFNEDTYKKDKEDEV